MTILYMCIVKLIENIMPDLKIHRGSGCGLLSVVESP